MAPGHNRPQDPNHETGKKLPKYWSGDTATRFMPAAKGLWLDGVHCQVRNHTCRINVEAVEKWVENGLLNRAQGVRVRTYASGTRRSRYNSSIAVQCETLSALDPSKKGDQRYAINLKAEVAIARQTFKYEEYFPNQAARLFGHAYSQITIRELIEEWLKDIERTHPHSTYRCYRKVVNAHLFTQFGDIRARRDLAATYSRLIRERNGTLKVSAMI